MSVSLDSTDHTRGIDAHVYDNPHLPTKLSSTTSSTSSSAPPQNSSIVGSALLQLNECQISASVTAEILQETKSSSATGAPPPGKLLLVKLDDFTQQLPISSGTATCPPVLPPALKRRRVITERSLAKHWRSVCEATDKLAASLTLLPPPNVVGKDLEAILNDGRVLEEAGFLVRQRKDGAWWRLTVTATVVDGAGVRSGGVPNEEGNVVEDLLDGIWVAVVRALRNVRFPNVVLGKEVSGVSLSSADAERFFVDERKGQSGEERGLVFHNIPLHATVESGAAKIRLASARKNPQAFLVAQTTPAVARARFLVPVFATPENEEMQRLSKCVSGTWISGKKDLEKMLRERAVALRGIVMDMEGNFEDEGAEVTSENAGSSDSDSES